MVLNKKPLKRITRKSEKVLAGKNKRFDLKSTDLSGVQLNVPTNNIVNKSITPSRKNAFLRGIKG